MGTVEVTFSNMSMPERARVTLQNSDGYVLTSLVSNRERYIATFPANGEMTVVLNDTHGYSYIYENEFTFEWECNTGPAVVPAAGFDASTYLTLPPAGTYERVFSEQAIYSWLIPCTGMLDIAATGSGRYVEFGYMNSNGTILASDWDWTTFNRNFNVAGNFKITLHIKKQGYYDWRFPFSWRCEAATVAPSVTRAPHTGTPTPPAATPEPLPKPQQCGVDTLPRRCGSTSRHCEWQVQHLGRLLSVGFSADGGRVATGAWDGAVRVFDVATGVQLVQMGCADFRVYDIAYSPDGTSVALGGEGGRVVVCDAATGVLTRELVNLNGSGSAPVRRVVWSGDGRYVVSGGGGDVRTRVFEVAGWAPSAVLQRHARDVAFSVDGSHLATVWGTEVDEVVTVWGLEDATSAAELRSVGGRVTALSFHDGELLRGLDNGVVSVTGWAGGFGSPSYERLSLQTRSGVVFDSSFSPDGTASVGMSDVTVWSSSDGAVLKDLVGHSQAVPRLAFSPDGARLATVGHEGALIMWTL